MPPRPEFGRHRAARAKTPEEARHFSLQIKLTEAEEDAITRASRNAMKTRSRWAGSPSMRESSMPMPEQRGHGTSATTRFSVGCSSAGQRCRLLAGLSDT
jgi:hypothetical protein